MGSYGMSDYLLHVYVHCQLFTEKVRSETDPDKRGTLQGVMVREGGWTVGVVTVFSQRTSILADSLFLLHTL